MRYFLLSLLIVSAMFSAMYLAITTQVGGIVFIVVAFILFVLMFARVLESQ